MKPIIIEDKKRTQMVAHRGLSGIEMENTHAAFVAAGNRSHYGIETDVHATADGRYVCIHDDDTGRVAGCSMVVEESAFDTLRALQLLDKDQKHGRTDLRIPTLEEYILLGRKYGKVCVLELKNPFPAAQIEEIVSIIRRLGWLEKTVFISFDWGNMIALRSLLPDQPCQFLTEKWDDGLIARLQANRLDLDIYYPLLTGERIRALHEAGVCVNCWTCDDPDAARRLIDWGVDMITSNILE